MLSTAFNLGRSLTRAVSMAFKAAWVLALLVSISYHDSRGQAQISLDNRNLTWPSNGALYHVPIWIDLNHNGVRDAGEGLGTYAASIGTTATLALYLQDALLLGSTTFRTGVADGYVVATTISFGGGFVYAGDTVPLTIKAWVGESYESASYRGSWSIQSSPLGGTTRDFFPLPPSRLDGWGDPSGVGYRLQQTVNVPDETLHFITGGEYFWDTDPGVANGIPVSVPAGEVARASFNADITGLSAGPHRLGFRVRKWVAGEWSDEVSWTPIIIEDTSNPSPSSLLAQNERSLLTAVESFWDTAPAPGSANPISIVPTQLYRSGGSINPSLSSLAIGNHKFGLRVKNAAGTWSEVNWMPILIYDSNSMFPGGAPMPGNEASRDLVMAEYFWDIDPGAGSATVLPIPRAQTARFGPPSGNDLILDFSTKTGGPHSIGFRVMDASGRWSTTERAPVAVPAAPIARFNGALYPNNVVVTNNGATMQLSLETRFLNGLVYYSLDGSSPTEIYDLPVTVTAPFVLRAIAFTEDFVLSEEMDWVVSVNDATKGGGAVSIVSTAIGETTGITTAQFRATPSAGWTFMGWARDGSGTDPNLTLVLNGAKSIEAIFGTGLITSNYAVGTITRSINDAFYPYGSTVRLSAMPNPGYFFRFWSGAPGQLVNSPIDFVVTNANPAVGASFALLSSSTFALNTLIEGQGAVIKTPQQPNYASNTVVSLTATPAPGNHFLWWTGDVSATGNPLSVTMTNSKTITAVFEADIIVNKLPTTTITSPANNSNFLTPVNLTITTATSDQDGYIVQTAFLTNGVQLGISTTSPFSFAWNNAPTGEYILRTITVDNRGGMATSPPVNITIRRPANQLPVVSLQSPTAADFLQSPTNVTLLAQATDSDGSIARVDFFGNGTFLGTSTTAGPGNTYTFIWTNAPVGANTIFVQATDNENAPANSPQVTITVQPPIPTTYRWETATTAVLENAGSISLKILKTGLDPGTVNVATAAISAIPGKDYVESLSSISFGPGEASKTVSITLLNEYVPDGDRTFEVRLSSAVAGQLATPATNVVTVSDDDAALEHNSFLEFGFVGDRPATRGRLQVYLEPGTASGQWRFPWDLIWRSSGEIAGDLDPGEYPVTLRARANYETPPIATNSVPGNTTVVVTNQYLFNSSLPGGSLTVVFSPLSAVDPGPVGWRFLGDLAYHTNNEKVIGIAAGIHVIEFRSLTGWIRPQSREVRIQGNIDTQVTAIYTLDSAAGGGSAALPVPLSNYSFIHSGQVNVPRQPFAMTGQLRSAAGSGSGIAVRKYVVLTAAHVLFDENTLDYVNSVDWFPERHAGEYEPRPIPARGWYVNTNYVYERKRERLEPGIGPGETTAASQQWDFAAVYFNEPVARGGFSGYLLSDQDANEWLISPRQKELFGYPLIGAATDGKMHWVPFFNYNFVRDSGRIFSSGGFLSYPGNSGGPILVQYTRTDGDIIFFPAAIYLGSKDNRSLARAIDSDVASLINRAESTAVLGVNFGDNGPIRLTPPGPIIGTVNVTVQINPPEAVSAGARWRIVGTTNLYASGQTLPQPTVPIQIDFNEVPGFTKPSIIPVNLTIGQNESLSGTYTSITNPNPPRITSIGASGNVITLRARRLTAGPAELQTSADLKTWTTLSTVNLGADTETQFQTTLAAPATTFFRLKNP